MGDKTKSSLEDTQKSSALMTQLRMWVSVLQQLNIYEPPRKLNGHRTNR